MLEPERRLLPATIPSTQQLYPQGDVVVVIPTSTTPETLRMGRGAVVNSSKAQAIGVIFACTKHTGSWPAAGLWFGLLVSHQSRAAEPKRPNKPAPAANTEKKGSVVAQTWCEAGWKPPFSLPAEESKVWSRRCRC